jgi:hypothetical protein
MLELEKCPSGLGVAAPSAGFVIRLGSAPVAAQTAHLADDIPSLRGVGDLVALELHRDSPCTMLGLVPFAA